MTNWSVNFISVFLGPYHRNTVSRPDNRRCRVIVLVKVVRTRVDMSSLTSVHSQWSYEYYVQSLCLPVLFHPLDPLHVGVVEGLQTDRFGLPSAEFLVRTQDSEQTGHEFRKTEDLTTVRASVSIFLLSITRDGICF